MSNSPVPPSSLDDRLERRHLVRVAEAGVRLAVELPGPGDRRRLEDRDLLRRVLEDRHRAPDRGAGRDRERERVLEADPALGLVGGEDRLGRRAAVGQDLEVDAGVGVPALGVRDVEPGVVRVGRPVEREADRSWARRPTARRQPRAPDGAAVRGGRGRRRGRRRAAARGGDEQRRWRRGRGCGVGCCTSASGLLGWAREPGPGRQRSPPPEPGTASTRAGLLPTPVRTGSGSAGLWSEPHSQRIRRSPEAIFSCRRESTPPAPADRPPATSGASAPEPRDDLGEHVLVLGLVVALVAQASWTRRVTLRMPPERLARADRARSGRPCRGRRRSASASRRSPRGGAFTRSCSANASAPKRTVERARVQRVGVARAPAPPGRARARPPGRPCAIRSLGSRPDSRAANARRQPAWVSSERRRREHEQVRQRPRLVRQDVAAARSARRASGRRARSGRPGLARAERARAARRGRRGAAPSRST